MAFTGVPAMICGSRALAAIEAEPQRYEGAGTARVGIAFGTVGCAVLALLIGRGMGIGSTGAAVSACVLGVAGVVGVVAMRTKLTWRVGRVVVLIAAPATLLIGAAWGRGAVWADERERLQRCAKYEMDIGTAITSKDVATARSDLSAARVTCPHSESGKLDTLTTATTQQEQAVQQAAADQAASAQAAAAAAKEKNAVAIFPQKAGAISADCKQAQVAMYSGIWKLAEENLDNAQSDLSSFAGTSVATTKDWTDLNAKVSALRDKLQPQLDIIAAREAKKAAADQAKADNAQAAESVSDAIRGPEPKLSAWDGACNVCERAIKAQLNDPSSYGHAATARPQIEGAYWTVETSFRAKNAFGALILTSKKCFIQQGQVVRIADID
jgi:hypothetical protein